MSMISAQCDELRAMAESVGLAMPQAATLMMEAADALDSLDLALDSKRIAERRVTELLAENAKLRELAAKMARALGINSEWCDRDCEREFGCYCEPCPLDQALRELGVEVDG